MREFLSLYLKIILIFLPVAETNLLTLKTECNL